MKKLIVFSTLLMSLLAFNVSASTATHGHKHAKMHHVKHHRHAHHSDPSYQN